MDNDNNRLNWHYLTHDPRAVVYLTWWIIATFGFIANHFSQQKLINGFWFTLTIIGLGVMWKVMPLKISKMRSIFICWSTVFAFGFLVSGLAFYIEAIESVIPYLGVFWMLLLAVGYLWNGLVDRPMKWYLFAVLINLMGAGLAYYVDEFATSQYLVASIVSFLSMGYLWLYRSEIM